MTKKIDFDLTTVYDMSNPDDRTAWARRNAFWARNAKETYEVICRIYRQDFIEKVGYRETWYEDQEIDTWVFGWGLSREQALKDAKRLNDLYAKERHNNDSLRERYKGTSNAFYSMATNPFGDENFLNVKPDPEGRDYMGVSVEYMVKVEEKSRQQRHGIRII